MSFLNYFNGVFLVVIIVFELKIYKLCTLDLWEIELHRHSIYHAVLPLDLFVFIPLILLFNLSFGLG
jgi:hypothetical protein